MDLSIRLAGFALAHAAWSISDLASGQTLTPFVLSEEGGARELMRLEMPTPKAAIEEGKRAIQALSERVDAWAFARDGILRMRDVPSAQHVLAVEFGSRDADVRHVVIQVYEPFAADHRFRMLGQPMITRGGELLSEQETRALFEQIEAGIREHPAVAELWPQWRA